MGKGIWIAAIRLNAQQQRNKIYLKEGSKEGRKGGREGEKEGRMNKEKYPGKYIHTIL